MQGNQVGKRIRDSENFGLFSRRKIGIGVVLEVLIKVSFLCSVRRVRAGAGPRS